MTKPSGWLREQHRRASEPASWLERLTIRFFWSSLLCGVGYLAYRWMTR